MTEREMGCAQGQGYLGPVTVCVAIISHGLQPWISIDMIAWDLGRCEVNSISAISAISPRQRDTSSSSLLSPLPPSHRHLLLESSRYFGVQAVTGLEAFPYSPVPHIITYVFVSSSTTTTNFHLPR
jgi:hypothetical protein